ncbi:MAG: carboxypeptidase-like regulatory domain-containing protein [Thermoplasmatales archaeon]|nr:carboxypeptidase-like regulatory domain-containing protein [Candidatus Thermoplasmatota archaeon]MCG2826238.1 carboxypeptidase-like regulatory domain-containing protein [Thermoplasmatales archaeon]
MKIKTLFLLSIALMFLCPILPVHGVGVQNNYRNDECAVPIWKVGDVWNYTSTGMDDKINFSLKVVDIDTINVNNTNYSVYVVAIKAEGSGNMSVSMSGNMYIQCSDIAIVKQNLTATSSYSYDGYSYSYTTTMTSTYSPPLKSFVFPLSVGRRWWSYSHVSSSYTMTGYSYTYNQTAEIYGYCAEKENISIVGENRSVYRIEYIEPGMEDPVPLMKSSVLLKHAEAGKSAEFPSVYYSPEIRNIVKIGSSKESGYAGYGIELSSFTVGSGESPSLFISGERKDFDNDGYKNDLRLMVFDQNHTVVSDANISVDSVDVGKTNISGILDMNNLSKGFHHITAQLNSAFASSDVYTGYEIRVCASTWDEDNDWYYDDVNITVYDTDGYPVQNASVYIDSVKKGETDENGIFSAYNFKRGEHGVVAKIGNFSANATFYSSGSGPYYIYVKADVMSCDADDVFNDVRIHVYDKNGNVSNASISLYNKNIVYINSKYSSYYDSYGETDANGNLYIYNLSEGSYSVKASYEGKTAYAYFSITLGGGEYDEYFKSIYISKVDAENQDGFIIMDDWITVDSPRASGTVEVYEWNDFDFNISITPTIWYDEDGNDIKARFNVDVSDEGTSTVTVYLNASKDGIIVASNNTTYTTTGSEYDYKTLYLYDLPEGDYVVTCTLFDSEGYLEDEETKNITIVNLTLSATMIDADKDCCFNDCLIVLTNSTGAGISGATLSVKSTDYSWRGQTDPAGKMLLHDLPEGNYSVSAYYKGYSASTTFFSLGSKPNNAPELYGAQVTPSSGSPGTRFIFSVVYKDADGQEPKTAGIWIDSNEYLMVSSGGNHSSGVIYTYATESLSSGIHNYYFEFSDGYNTTHLPEAGSYSLSVNVGSEYSEENTEETSNNGGSEKSPGLIPGFEVATLICGIMLCLFIKKKKELKHL